jgi:hypothetical protein
MTRPITVLLNQGDNLKIERVESEKSLFKTVPKEVRPGRMVQLWVEPVFENLKTGPNADRLKIHTNQKEAELLVVPVSFEIRQADEDGDDGEEDEDMDGDIADDDEEEDD